ncbi:Kelch repeat-containing protein [Flavilitoribacter nigricans]|uniref:Galactose oxidase n=1 Tax=Flavilitoribacter nigricans (strain ATCC 23147 / DSM 23189 / NBRC 102662 / NCIMB 1420 / SS-2) TaxID=1122177 RepID=A0A2D0NIP6_FLAN2|nr:kelch repeat-containing protein [Flavilitoribacter nigricans]PHN08374.1 galactose oxidase [Flavilitoribacter nigricans DSM 23189 = NBRC 102662]
MKNICLPIYLLVFGLCWSLNTGSAQSGSQWESLSAADGSEPVQRHEAAFVRIGEKFYLLGGRGIRPVSIYDPQSQTWTLGQKPPVEIHHFQPVVYNDKVYIIGALTGQYPGETPLPKVIIYDPATDEWSEGATIPENRRRGSAGLSVYKDKIYIACGIKDGHRGDHKTWLDVYDPQTNTWEQLPDAPRARDHFQAVVVKHKLYLVGGRRSAAPDNVFNDLEGKVDVYDLKKGTWSTISEELPTKRAGLFLATVPKNKIVVLGGETGDQQLAHSEMEVLNTKKGSWESWSPMIQGRHGTGAIVYKGQLIVASGCGNRGGSPELKTMEVYNLK